MKVDKNDYILFKDSFGIAHVGVVTSNEYYPESGRTEIGTMVLKSIDKSNLNTATIDYSNIEMKFDRKPNLDTLEEDYPEIWI